MTGVATRSTPPTPQRPRPPRSGRASSRPWLALLGGVIAFLFVLPLWWTLVSALRPQQETFRTISPVSIWTILPRDFTFANFGRLGEGDFGLAMVNSMIVAGATRS